MTDIYEIMRSTGIVPVVKINSAKNAEKLAEAFLRGGLSIVEITFRSDAAEQAIRDISRAVPEMCVCAGTVLTMETARRAVDAGARAIISPGTNPQVVSWCIGRGIPVIPGCATPSDVERCMSFGLRIVKLFPAEVLGGVKYLKALRGPYPEVGFMPTGGISPQNLREYLAQKNVLACGGSWLAPEALVDGGEFSRITELAAEAMKLTREVQEK